MDTTVTGTITALPGTIDGWIVQVPPIKDWVAASGRKPPNRKVVEVLVLWEVKLARWFDGEWIGHNGNQMRNVSHWRFKGDIWGRGL
ncbi:MAG: hypothetical protein KA259_03230 [Caldilineaceae bacterium]|nr:hypothetical protein [Caldilineaceae bacterium]